MVLIRLRSSKLNRDEDITREVESDISADALADLAKENFESFDQRSVKIYLDTGEEFHNGKHTIEEGQTFYATQDHTHVSSDEEGIIRLCIIGPGGVGKSALTMRFQIDHFTEDYHPTIEEFYRITRTIDGRDAKLDILDTAGQEDFQALRAVWYRRKDGFILVYAMNDPNSLDGLEKFYTEISSFYENQVVPPILLVGNKADLEDENSSTLVKNAETKAENWNVVDHMKTSAKTSYNVKAAFANIVRATRVDEESAPSQCCLVL